MFGSRFEAVTVGYNALESVESQLTFQRNMSFPSSLGLLFNAEDGGDMFL
jgi:hypothetical protein